MMFTALKPIEVAKKMAVVPQDNTVGFNFSVMDVVLMGRNPHLGFFPDGKPKRRGSSQKSNGIN